MKVSELIHKLETDSIPRLKDILANVGDGEVAFNTPLQNYEIKNIDVCHGNIQERLFITLSISV